MNHGYALGVNGGGLGGQLAFQQNRAQENGKISGGPPPPPPPGAKKFDGDKPMMDLLMDGCPRALSGVGAVLTYGFQKYGGKHGWKALPDAMKRYESAMVRHQLALATGEDIDPESGLPHRAHIACNALFLLELDLMLKSVKVSK